MTVANFNIFIYFIFIALLVLASKLPASAQSYDHELSTAVASLTGVCLTYSTESEWWSYKWCHESHVEQYHINHQLNDVLESVTRIGEYSSRQSTDLQQVYMSVTADCIPDRSTDALFRTVAVSFHCCVNGDIKKQSDLADVQDLLIHSVREPTACHYEISICYKKLCDIFLDFMHKEKFDDIKNMPANVLLRLKDEQQGTSDQHPSATKESDSSSESDESSSTTNNNNRNKYEKYPLFSVEQQKDALERVRKMFYHAYDSYISYAYPEVIYIYILKNTYNIMI